MRKKIELIGVAVFGSILFVAGYSIGYAHAMNFCVDTALKVLDLEIKPDMLIHLIGKYGGRI